MNDSVQTEQTDIHELVPIGILEAIAPDLAEQAKMTGHLPTLNEVNIHLLIQGSK